MKPTSHEYKIVEVFSDRVTLIMDDGRMFYASIAVKGDLEVGDIGILRVDAIDDQGVPIKPALTAIKK